MRATVGCSVCLAAITASIAYAGSQVESTSIHPQSFYQIDKKGMTTLQRSDALPWYVVKHADWGNAGVLKLGYLPVLHGSKQYYCLVEKVDRIGSRFPDKVLLCGDPMTVESVVANNYQVTLPPLEFSPTGPGPFGP